MALWTCTSLLPCCVWASGGLFTWAALAVQSSRRLHVEQSLGRLKRFVKTDHVVSRHLHWGEEQRDKLSANTALHTEHAPRGAALVQHRRITKNKKSTERSCDFEKKDFSHNSRKAATSTILKCGLPCLGFVDALRSSLPVSCNLLSERRTPFLPAGGATAAAAAQITDVVFKVCTTTTPSDGGVL